MLRVGLAANPADVADALALVLHDLFARPFVLHRPAEQPLIEPQRNPHPLAIAHQHLELNRQFGVSRRRSGRRHPLKAVTRRLIAAAKLVLQPVEIDELSYLKSKTGWSIPCLSGK